MFNLQILIDGIFAGCGVLILGVFVVSWLLSLRDQKSAPVGRGRRLFSLPGWMQATGGLTVTILLLIAGFLAWVGLPLKLSYSTQTILMALGLVVFLAGIAILLWARRELGAMYGVSTSTVVQLKSQHQLIESGPYAYTRHPIYLGIWLVLAGLLLAYLTWAAVLMLVFFVPGLYMRARREELVLESEFGGQWQAYSSRVPMFIPTWRVIRSGLDK